MKALYEKIPVPPGHSFASHQFHSPAFTMPWHFHPECELTLIVCARGTRFVGDNIEHFDDGDLVLLGSNLPHYWWKDAEDRREAHSVVIQFDENFGGVPVLDLPEARNIRALLVRAGLGLAITGPARDEIVSRMFHLITLDPWPRLCALMEILGVLAETRTLRKLASAGYAPDLDDRAGQRLTAVCRYVNESFAEPVSHQAAARLAGLSPAAFSRYFRKHMGRTFEAYVNEVRIGNASRRLMDTDRTVAEIAFACGFNNLSNFNRRFLRLKGVSPRQYRTISTRTMAPE